MSFVSAYVPGERPPIVTRSLLPLDVGVGVGRIIAAPDHTLRELREHIGGTFSFGSVPFGSHSTCTIAWRGFDVFSRPLRSSSPTSDARYWIVHPFPAQRSLVLLQTLPEYGKTSVHVHADEEETFHGLAGWCRLSLGNRLASDPWKATKEAEVELTEQSAFDVPAGLAHQLTTLGSPVLNLIVIRNTRARTLEELRHQYVAWVEDAG